MKNFERQRSTPFKFIIIQQVPTRETFKKLLKKNLW